MGKLRNIVIVGAGFAGWATALHMQAIFKNANITVIGSSELNIIGAGEGTTPMIRTFLDKIKITPEELIQNCKSTLKYAVRFDNWNKEGKGTYYNSFRGTPAVDSEYASLLYDLNIDIINMHCYLYDMQFSELGIFDAYLNKNKVLFDHHTLQTLHTGNNKLVNNPALHFDAIEIAEYLKGIGISRNIKYVDDFVIDFAQDDDGKITKIKCKNSEFPVDFVFDCSGMKRLIIGKLYESEFINVNDRLPVNRAIPFFLPPKDEIEPYTTSTAMKFGWSWKIPLQHRYGCGYVFDDTVCTENEILKEIEENHPNERIDIPKSFSFNSGYYNEIWIKNCIAIGLSSSFLEPLEATSIWMSIACLLHLESHIATMENLSKQDMDYYNAKFRCSMEHFIAYIQFHYLNKREDTAFWRKVNSRPISTELKSTLSYKTLLPGTFYDQTKFSNDMLIPLTSFGQVGWLSVGLGINYFEKKDLQKIYDSYSHFYLEILQNLNQRRILIQNEVEKAMSHTEYLQRIIGTYRLRENKNLIFK